VADGPPGAYPRATWRLLVDGLADGASNMAIDQAIMEAVVAGNRRPTLRFYGWSPPCLSLGRNQPLADVDLAACRAMGIDVVRRPSGGRAILHTDELTYAVMMLQDDPRSEGGVLASYRRLSRGLLAGLRCLGVDAIQASGQNKGEPTAICFETPSDYEITVGGRKLVGSAQWRAQGGVLQHGSLPLYGDLARIVACLALTPEVRAWQRSCLQNRALTLEAARGRPVTFEETVQALAEGFAQALNLSLAEGELSAPERASAAAWRRTRYAAPAWTERP
jgi:lipoate-protein ligase A